MKTLLVSIFIFLSACASTTYVSEYNPIGTVKLTNQLKTGAASLQRANIFSDCSGEWGRKANAKYGETTKRLASADEDNLFLLSQTPAIEDSQCAFVVTLTLGDTETLNFTLKQDETGVCSVTGDIENTTISEYVSIEADDVFCL